MPSAGDPLDEMRDNEARDETAQEQTQTQTQTQEPHKHKQEQEMQIDEQPQEDDDALKPDQQERPELSPSEASSMTAMAVSTEIATSTGAEEAAETAETTQTDNSVKRPQTEDTTTQKGSPADNGLADSDNTPPPTKRRALCGVCDTEPSKYKCSRCLLRYCSVACSRIHQENHPPDEPKKEECTTAAPAAEAQAQTTTPVHPFQVLDDAPELRRLFEQYPRLPARLRTIHDATLPPKNPSAFASRGGRGGGRGGRGGRGGFSGTPQPWTKEIGLLQGQKALRRARVDPTEDGDAVRAYCELVTYLLSKGASSSAAAATATATAAAAANSHATAIVRAELEAEGTQVIKQLLDAEGRQ